MRNTVSRVMYLMIIYLELLSPAISIDLPKSTTGSRMALCLVFLRMGFTLPLSLPIGRWSLTLAFSPLSDKVRR